MLPKVARVCRSFGISPAVSPDMGQCWPEIDGGQAKFHQSRPNFGRGPNVGRRWQNLGRLRLNADQCRPMSASLAGVGRM